MLCVFLIPPNLKDTPIDNTIICYCYERSVAERNYLLDAIDYLADIGRRIREASNRLKDSDSQERLSPMHEPAEPQSTAQEREGC